MQFTKVAVKATIRPFHEVNRMYHDDSVGFPWGLLSGFSSGAFYLHQEDGEQRPPLRHNRPSRSLVEMNHVIESPVEVKLRTLADDALFPLSNNSPSARRRRCIVENSNLAVRHHIVDETDVHPLPPAVGIAHARIDPCGCDLRNADAASMLTDLVRECLRTCAHHCSKRRNH